MVQTVHANFAGEAEYRKEKIMGKAKIVIEETENGYTVETNVKGMKLLYPLNQIAINIAADWGVDKEKYFGLLDEIWEQQKATIRQKISRKQKYLIRGIYHERRKKNSRN